MRDLPNDSVKVREAQQKRQLETASFYPYYSGIRPKMASFFKPVCDIEIRLDGEDARDMVEFKTGGKDRKEKAPLYKDGESVKGSVIVRPKDGKKLEHTGIKVNLIGSIGMYSR